MAFGSYVPLAFFLAGSSAMTSALRLAGNVNGDGDRDLERLRGDRRGLPLAVETERDLDLRASVDVPSIFGDVGTSRRVDGFAASFSCDV